MGKRADRNKPIKINDDKKKKKLNGVKNVFIALVWILVFVIVIQGFIIRTNKDYIPKILGVTYLNVLSNSMEPEFKKNDLCIGTRVKDTSNLKVGDVITYKDYNRLVTHRIVEITEEGFMTKGDANDVKDELVVSGEQVVSRYAFKIPKGGFIIGKLQNFEFLGLAWLIIMYFILKEIYLEIKKQKIAKAHTEDDDGKKTEDPVEHLKGESV